MNTNAQRQWFWKCALLLVILVGSLLVLLSRPPILQDPEYHKFADQRTFLGIPHFMDVVTNLPFLIVGLSALLLNFRHRFPGYAATWAGFFIGVALLSAGSAYYHWHPSDDTLFWDRLPMTIAFMTMLVALSSEFIDRRLGRFLLGPALLIGFSSVIYWHWSGDLRFYAWVQLLPLLTVPIMMALFRSGYSLSWLLLISLGCYVLAKIAERYDTQIFALTSGNVGGHAIEHILAAVSCLVVLEMLRRRKKIPERLLKRTLFF